jgi:hypothetical protein
MDTELHKTSAYKKSFYYTGPADAGGSLNIETRRWR